MASTANPYAKLKAPDLTKAMSRYGDELEKSGHEVLEKAVPEINKGLRGIFAEGQGKWKALNPAYKAAKKRRGYSDKILIRTGRMYKALVGNSGDTVQEITNTTLLKGLTDSFYDEYPKYSQGEGRVNRFIEFTVQKQKDLRRFIANELWKRKRGLDKKHFSRLAPK